MAGRRTSTPEQKAAARAKAIAEGTMTGSRARGYSWPQFTAESNAERNTTHGAGTLGVIGDRWTPAPARELASAMTADLLASDACPEYLHWPQFAHQVMAWSRFEAKAKLFHDYLETLSAEEQMTPRKAGGESPASQWLAAERAAERARDKLGLTPAAWAKIRKDLGLTKRDQESKLDRFGAGGEEIIAQRALRAAPITAEPAED
jgi:hypothetical protein